jgi:hypothetical protein
MRGLIAVFVTIIGGLFITAGLVPVSANSVDQTNSEAYWEQVYQGYECTKIEPPTAKNEFGELADDNKAVVLDAYTGSLVLIVKSGSVDSGFGPGNAVYEDPTAGVNYYGPLNDGGQQGTVSHWTVCTKDDEGEEEPSAELSYEVVCSADADGHVAVTFANTGDGDGEATLNGETVAIASGATVEKTVALTDGSADVTIEIDGEVVYDKTVDCASDDDGEVIGGTTTKTPEVLPHTAGDSTAAVVTLITAATAGIAVLGAATRRLLSSEV